MLPIHLLAWETDATLRAAIEESLATTIAPIGAPALLSGGELGAELRAAGPRSLYAAEARARYARTFDLSGGGGAPEDSLDGDFTAAATWTTSPLTSLALATQGSLATTFGMRADSLLLSRDPFLDAQRLEYGAGADLTLSLTATPRAEITADAGVLQEGALAASDPAVVGADSREAHAGLSFGYDLGPRVSLGPEARYSFTRYEHALLDADRRRGVADVHATTATLGATYRLTPNLTFSASGGLTLASPMPMARTDAAVIAPEAGLRLRYRAPRLRLDARYSWSYSSLGPRLGPGQAHALTLRITAWPLPARVARGASFRGLLRASHGAAPLGLDPPPPTPGLPPPPTTGTLITTAVGARASLDLPIARGFALTVGVDALYARGRVEPSPGEARQALTAVFTLGLARTFSTDRHRLFPRDPGADEDDALRRGAPPGAAQRWEDRTRVDGGRAEEGP